MKKKLTAVTKLGTSESGMGIEIGSRLKFISEQIRDYTNYEAHFYDYPLKDTGRLALDNDLMTFCNSDFARVFGLSVRELKKLFPKNSIAKVKITIEVEKVEQWEYTP